MNNPIAKTIKPELVAAYRSGRLDSGIMSTILNRELIVFRELRRLSVIDYDSPILSINSIREVKKELAYLSFAQLQVLNDKVMPSSNESLRFVVVICLVTGARWSEAEGLELANWY